VTHRIGIIGGDGIGPDVIAEGLKVIGAAGVELETVDYDLGGARYGRDGTVLPDEVIEEWRSLDALYLGAVGTPEVPPGLIERGLLLKMRFALDLYVNLRPFVYPAGGIDFRVVRENTEGFYADRNMFVGSGEFMPTPDVALAVGVFTRDACERIARRAFALAQGRRKHVTIVHKTNVLALTTGLFRDACRSVAEDFPDVHVDEEHIDALTAHLVRRGSDFDVIVAENMFGDILSDLAGELSGSLGMAPSLNASETKAMAQAAHGSAPDIAGRNRANPTALILSSAMLLDWLAEHDGDVRLTAAATRIRSAVRGTLESGVATADVGGLASTAEFTEAVIARTLRR